MRIIQGLKQLKDLARKAADLRAKVAKYHCDMDFEKPAYETEDKQRDVVAGWMQSHSDVLREIEKLRYRIQKTNVATQVTIEIGDNRITKSICEWIARRKDLVALDLEMWRQLTDRNLKGEAIVKNSSGENVTVRMRRYYDLKKKDQRMEVLASEPSLIDGELEIVNAVTDLLE